MWNGVSSLVSIDIVSCAGFDGAVNSIYIIILFFMSARDGMRGVSLSPKVTPPGSLIELPPSPPSIGRSAYAPSRSYLVVSVRWI